MSPTEREALDLAERWAAADPFYEGEKPSHREQALMALAVRCYSSPIFVMAQLGQLERRQRQQARTESEDTG